MLRYACLAVLAGCFEPITFPDTGPDLDLDLFPPVGTDGVAGRIKFAYAEGCEQGLFSTMCAIDSGPILDGATARIELQPNFDNLPADLTLASSDPSVFDVSRAAGATFARVTAHKPGTASLVASSGGQIYDLIDLRVAEAASLAFPDATPTFFAASPESLPALAKDANGKPLFGRGAIQFSIGGLQLHTDYDPAADLAFTGTDHVVVSGTALGQVIVSAQLGTLAATVPVAIVDASAVAKIAASDFGDAGLFQPQTATGIPVRGAHCTASVAAAFPVTLRTQPQGVVPGVFPGDLVLADSTGHGTATLSCAIGSVVGSVDLTF